MRFKEAKGAIKRSRSIEDIRQARETIKGLDDEHYHLPFEFPVASELLDAYLARKSLPYNKQPNARIYLSADGKVNYDAYTLGEVHDPTYVFGIADESRHAEVNGLQTPQFSDVVASAPIEQPSITNIIHVKNTGLVVFKAFLKKSLSTMARSKIPRANALYDEKRAVSESAQLALLGDIFKNSADVYVPRVLGHSRSVIAMEYIQGEDISELTFKRFLNKHDFLAIADVLATIHIEFARNAEKIKGKFNIPESHTANSVVSFEKRTSQFHHEHRDNGLKQELFDRFTSLIERGRQVIADNHEAYHDYRDLIYGDFKDENLIKMPDGRIALIDPTICAGRNSMDIAKFARSILFKDPTTYTKHFHDFLRRYQEQTDTVVNEREVANMLGIDMLNIMRSYFLIPEKQVLVFPPTVRNVRQHAKYYLDFIDNVFASNLQLELAH
ncbi:MAG: hypothetical protein Q7S01_01460 [bacterium]|nr:hypothetical protein [bacterium]